MAELPLKTRLRLERDIRRAVKRAFKPYRKPPSGRNRQPPWSKIRKKMVADLEPILEKVRQEAARNLVVQHGTGPLPPDFEFPASNRAAELVEDMIDVSRQRWKELPRPLRKEDVRAWYKRNLGDDRAETVARTELTMAQTKGEEAALPIIRQQGVSLDGIWKAFPDACPICTPFHNKPSSIWKTAFPAGPPAHPRCRCSLEYKKVADAL